MSAFILLAAAAAVVVLALLAGGVVLLILGISRKRTGLWVTGLVIVLLIPVLLLPAFGMLIFFQARVTRQTQATWAQVAVSTQDGFRHIEFQMCTGIEPPQATAIPHSTTLLTDEGRERYYFRLESGDGLPGLLATHFTPATWDDLKAHMSTPDGPAGDEGWWDPEKMKHLACYRRTYTDEFNTTYEIYAAFDKAGNVLCLLAVEQP